MTTHTSPAAKLSQTKPSWLSKLLQTVGSNKTALLINILAAAIWWPVPVLLTLVWKAIATVTPAPNTLLSLMRSELRVSAWELLALFLLPLVLLHLSWYVRLYRYRADTIFGLDFTWWYSFPIGRVVHVRAFCPHCRKPAPEPTFFLDRYDNYLCHNCDYNTESRHAQRMEYPWCWAIQRRVYERFYKPPAA